MIIMDTMIVVAIVDAILFTKKGRKAISGVIYGIFTYMVTLTIFCTIIEGTLLLAIVCMVISILATFIIKNK